MKDFVLDLWYDLREKRLWPIAALLLVALIGVPVLLLKGTPEQTEPPVASGGAQTALPVVTADTSGIAGSSKLGSFDPKDPFRSRADAPGGAAAPTGVAPAGSDAGATGDLAGGLESSSDTTASGGAGGSSSESPGAGGLSGGSGGGSSAPPSAPSGSGSGSGGSDPGSGSGSGGSPSPTPSPAPSPGEAKFYEYAVDVELGPIGNERRYRDVRALDMLPNDRDPVVVYLGQTRDNESSFLVNQRFAHGVEGETSEGTCLPNKLDCNFVYLRTDNRQDDHYFTERAGDKREFHLKLIAVNRKLDSRGASGSSEPPSSERRAKTRGAKSNRKVRRTAFDFRIPLIAGRQR